MSGETIDMATDGSETRPQCLYTGCESPVKQRPPGTAGRPSVYCDREDHNAISAFKARQRKDAKAAGQPVPDDVDRPVSVAAAVAVDLRADVLSAMQRLSGDLDRYVEKLQIVTDPEAAEAQMLAVTNEAAVRISAAEATAATEKTRRHAAEEAKQAAEGLQAAAEAAAEEAIENLEQATARLQAEAERIAAEATAEVQAARDDADRRVEEVQRDAAERITAADTAASERIRVAEEEAEAKVAEIQAVAEREMARQASEASERIATAETAAGRAQAETERVKREAAEQVATAQAAEKEAGDRAVTAQAEATQAKRDADAQVGAAQRTVDALGQELERARVDVQAAAARSSDLEARLDELRNDVDEARRLTRKEEDARRAVEERLRKLTSQGAGAISGDEGAPGV